MFHVGYGQMVCYRTLNKYILAMKNKGDSVHGFHQTLVDDCETTGAKFSLTYKNWVIAVDGFKTNLEFDYSECFTCLNCSKSPRYLTADGVALAVLQRKFQSLGISELTTHKNDKHILSQGSYHHDRVFLNQPSEREAFQKMLLDEIKVSEFIDSNNITSMNGMLLVNIVKRNSNIHPDHLPSCYKKFFHELAKNVPACGIIQVTNKGKDALKFLRSFCKEELNLRNGEHCDELYVVRSQLPAFWKTINDICIYICIHSSGCLETTPN